MNIDNLKIRDHRAILEKSFLLVPKSLKTEAKRLTLTIEKDRSPSFFSGAPQLFFFLKNKVSALV